MMLSRTQRHVLIGDVVVLVVLTIVGFVSHNELNAGPRMLTTFVPSLVAWLWVSPWFDLFDEATLYAPGRMAWRTAWAWTLVGPLAVSLRAIWLNRVVLPVFLLVFTGANLVVFTLWRGAFAWFKARGTT